jgi:hypothetical protein
MTGCGEGRWVQAPILRAADGGRYWLTAPQTWRSRASRPQALR